MRSGGKFWDINRDEKRRSKGESIRASKSVYL